MDISGVSIVGTLIQQRLEANNNLPSPKLLGQNST